MKKVQVTKLGVGSFARVVAVTQAIIAFVYGLIATLGVAAGEINEDTSFVSTLGVSVAVLGLAVVIFPIIGYIIGWIQGAIVSSVLNFVFKEAGGLTLEIEEKK